MSKAIVLLGDLGSDHEGFPPTPVIAGSPDVLIDGKPVARVGDPLAPHSKPKHPPHPRTITGGSSTVMINGKPAAVTGGAISCGGVTIGSGSVVIGDTHTPASFSGVSSAPAKLGRIFDAAESKSGVEGLLDAEMKTGPSQLRDGSRADDADLKHSQDKILTRPNKREKAGNSLRIGIFFDGTANHKDNDKHLPDRDITNVAKLFDLYESGANSERIYIPGPGTIAGHIAPDGFDAREDIIGLALGVGPEGGHKRIQTAITALNDILDESKPDVVVLDVFGFSRGAALARHFVNLVNEWPASIILPEINEPSLSTSVVSFRKLNAFPRDITARVGFIGLFDTVGSFYLPGNQNNLDFNVNLRPDSADRIVHLTAHHEIRRNFPLSSIREPAGLPSNFSEIALPGVHSDVGGGYENPVGGIQNHEIFTVRVFSGHGMNYRTIQSAQKKIEALNRNDHRNIQARVEGTDVIAEERRATRKELAIHALHLMYEMAVSEGLPMSPMDLSNANHRIPDDLKKAIDAWQEAGANLFAARKYLGKYMHTSHREDVLPHLPENSGKRRIFYNRPSLAVQQQEVTARP
ncbi:MAG: type VI secretion system PAAR protein [Marinobacter sp.]|jgi:uncharacterized Zn-binding protein involved in type VI secretion|nr:type VI secretion system PAAR protein [Marinobacter sp.]|tara:strand:- start:760 stop:2496 length:1737 start_codon:yes stop_codon:yes gene_type:complete